MAAVFLLAAMSGAMDAACSRARVCVFQVGTLCGDGCVHDVSACSCWRLPKAVREGARMKCYVMEQSAGPRFLLRKLRMQPGYSRAFPESAQHRQTPMWSAATLCCSCTLPGMARHYR